MASKKDSMLVPVAIYNAMVKEAKKKHQTLKEYKDDLAIFLLFGEFDP